MTRATKELVNRRIPAQIQNAFGGLGSEYLYDVVSGRLWDVLRCRANSPLPSLHEFFSEPVGVAKLYADTNMQEAKRLPAPQMFSVQRILFLFGGGTDKQDAAEVAERGLFHFRLTSKSYASAIISHLETGSTIPCSPVRICQYCQAVFAESFQCPGCGAREFLLGGSHDATLATAFRMELAVPVVLANQVSFYMELRVQPSYTPRGDVILWCCLEGLHARGVQ